MSREEYLKFYIHLLEMEVEALRSVLSELRNKYDADVDCYTQMTKANRIDDFKNSLVHP